MKKHKEFWIELDTTVLLNNRRHYVYDKEQHDDLFYNDGEAYDNFIKNKNTIHTIEMKAYKELEEKLEIAKDALRDIDKWWDTTDPEYVKPAFENVSTFRTYRNDSMAAGSIVRAKQALQKIEGKI